jgi:hypothetical protein
MDQLLGICLDSGDRNVKNPMDTIRIPTEHGRKVECLICMVPVYDGMSVHTSGAYVRNHCKSYSTTLQEVTKT